MLRQSSMPTGSSPKDSPTAEDWDNSIETQDHRLAWKMSNRNFTEGVDGNTAASPVIKLASGTMESETQYPVVIGGRSCLKTAADVQNFCQLHDPPAVNIAIETGVNHQIPTYHEHRDDSAPRRSGTHTIACLSSASSRHIEDRSYNERISIWFKGELRHALLPLSIEPPLIFNPESRRASVMKFKGKTRANDADALWEAALRNQNLDEPEATHHLLILGEGSMFKTAQEVTDYFAWLDLPPAFEVSNMTNTEQFQVCEISAADVNTIREVLLYKHIAVEFQGESITALLSFNVSPTWQVTPKPPITLPGDVSVRHYGIKRNSLREAAPSNQNHTDCDVTIGNLTRPEGLYPLVIRKFPGEDDILNSSASSPTTIVHTWETTAYPQPKPAAAQNFNRDPMIRFYPSAPIVYVTGDIRRQLEARGPGVNEVVWLKDHPMFAWRSFDYEFNLDWEQCLAELTREKKGQNNEVGIGRSIMHKPENYDRASTDAIPTSPTTIGWPCTGRNGLGCTEPMKVGEPPTAFESTVADIRRNKKNLRSSKAIDMCEVAGPHTGTDTIDWAERMGIGHEMIHSKVSEISDEAKDGEKNPTDEKAKKSGSFKSGIKKLLGFGRRG